jgi:tRNA(His) 5'-end guanylyltransferase
MDRTYFYDKGHINNLYNTTFWALIQNGGMDAKEAEKALAVRFLMGFDKSSLLTV